MSGKLTLYGYKYSNTVQRVLATAKFANAPVELKNVNWGDASRDSLRKKSQTGTFPYLETPNGSLSEAFAIVQYLAATYNKALLGANDWEQALVSQWVQFAHWEITRFSKALLYPIFGFYEYNSAEGAKALGELKDWLKNLDKHLDNRDFIVGDAYTLADLEVFYALRGYFQMIFTEDFRKGFANLTAWFTKLAANAHVVACYGRTLLCKVAQPYPKLSAGHKLVGYKFSSTVQRCLAAAKFAGVNVELENVNWGDAQRDQLRSNSQTGTFPYLKTPHGTLSEAFAICKYFSNQTNTLFGSDEFEKAQINQWVEFAHNELNKHAKALLYPLFGFAEFSKEQNDSAMKELKEWLKVLNAELKCKDFVVGDAYTMADLELFVSLRAYFQLVFAEDIRKNVFPNVSAWFAKLAAHPFMVESYGRTLMCKMPQKAVKVEINKDAPKKKEEAKKKDEPKKAEKPAAGADEDEEKSSKKKANPLDLLPPPTLVLDDFKREFLNSKDKPAVLKDFWTKFNETDYSLWWMRYDKLESEGKILFRTKNSMGFFLQKLDCFRKYSFSAHGIYGTEGDYDVRGVWMWRGSEIPEEVKQHESYEYMQIRKLDSTKEEDRKLVESFWLNINEGAVVDGLPVAYAETFK